MPKGYDFQTLKDAALRRKKKKFLSRPIRQIDPAATKTVADLVDAFGEASIQARRIGQCAEVMRRMLTDKDRPTVFLGIAGPLIAAGLRKVIRTMIEERIVDVVVSTGAILYQDFYQAHGGGHWRGDPEADDAKLRDMFVNRIYDTYVDEEKFAEFDTTVAQHANSMTPGVYSTRQYLDSLGATLKDPESILGTCHRLGVPVFCPAIADSSIGIGLMENYHWRHKAGRAGIVLDTIQDNYEVTQIVVNSPCTAAFYVAGGVPKNYINDAVVMAFCLGRDTGGHRYALQITTDVPHWGGLSGSTLAEATSWGKINPEATRAMAFVEPSVSLPLLATAALQKGWAKNRSRIRFAWDGCNLTSMKPEARKAAARASARSAARSR